MKEISIMAIDTKKGSTLHSLSIGIGNQWKLLPSIYNNFTEFFIHFFAKPSFNGYSLKVQINVVISRFTRDKLFWILDKLLIYQGLQRFKIGKFFLPLTIIHQKCFPTLLSQGLLLVLYFEILIRH